MYKVFFIIFAFEYINANNDESNEKYIDLLPEEEKQEFLNRIARRILEEVNSHDTPNESHADINDEQLDAQNAFVNDIIKEESENLHSERRDANNVDKKETDRGDDKDDTDRYIDLTLRTKEKDARKSDEHKENLEKSSEFQVIPVKTVYDDGNAEPDNKIPQSNINVNSSADDMNITEIVTKNLENDLTTSNDTKISSENLKGIRKSYEEKILFRTTMSDDPNSDEVTSGTNDVISTTIQPESQENVTTPEPNDELIWISTQKIYDSETDNESKSYENEEAISSSNLTTLNNAEQTTTTSISNTTEEIKTNKQELPLTTPKNNLNISEASDDITKNEQTYVRSGNVGLNHSMTVKDERIHLSISNLTENKSDLNGSSNQATPAVRTVLEKNNIQLNVSENKKNIDEKSKVLKLLRQSTSKKFKIDDMSQKDNLKSKAKVYEVFEIGTDQSPFVKKSKEENVENEVPVYFVPVYNYDSKNVHFNPRSRFGSTTEYKYDDNKKYGSVEDSKEAGEVLKSDLPVVRSIFSGYKKRDPTIYKNNKENYALKKQNQNFFQSNRPANKNIENIYYNPSDYLDVDYYFGRTNRNPVRSGNKLADGKIFPDSNEPDHPFNSLHKGDMKDHISTVRKILYLKQIFEHIPEVNKKKKLHVRRKKGKALDNEHEKFKPDADNIAADYYFGFNPNQDLLPAERSNQVNKVNSSSNSNEYNEEIEALLEVMRDFIKFDNGALAKYNWLESTVDILSAIEKLLELTKQLQFRQPIHPNDVELLKYTLYLYKSCVDSFKQNDGINEDEEKMKRKKTILPKNKYKKKIREPLKLWRDVAKFIRNKEEKQEGRIKLLYDFEDFLQKILFHLNDLHDAIKHIAIITKYDKQKWFEDLKNIYFNEATDKQLLRLLLHLSVSGLLNSIEESASSGVENNFREYIKDNDKYVKKSKEEFLFVLNVLNELKQFN